MLQKVPVVFRLTQREGTKEEEDGTTEERDVSVVMREKGASVLRIDDCSVVNEVVDSTKVKIKIDICYISVRMISFTA